MFDEKGVRLQNEYVKMDEEGIIAAIENKEFDNERARLKKIQNEELEKLNEFMSGEVA